MAIFGTDVTGLGAIPYQGDEGGAYGQYAGTGGSQGYFNPVDTTTNFHDWRTGLEINRPRDFLQQQLGDMYDPNAKYAFGYGKKPQGVDKYDYVNSIYQLGGDQWNPIRSMDNRRVPGSQTWSEFGPAFLAAAGAALGGGAAYGALSGAGAGATGAGAVGGAEAGSIGAMAPVDYSIASGTGLGTTATGSGITPLGAGSAMGSGIGYIPTTVGTVGTVGSGLTGGYAGTEAMGLRAPAGFNFAGDLGSSLGAYDSSGLSSMYEAPSAANYSLSDYSSFGDGGGLSFTNSGGGTGSGLSQPAPAAWGPEASGSSGSLWDDFTRIYKKASPYVRAGQNVARLIGGVTQGRQASKVAGNQAKQLQQQQKQLADMFGPDSAYAKQLKQALERRDAAAGRRSQYGPREVELQAALAGMNSRNAPAIAQLSQQEMAARGAQQGAKNQQIFSAIQGIPALYETGRSLFDLFG